MTKTEIQKLDKLYQEILLAKYNYTSIFGGEADLVHHFLQGRYMSIRWYLPIGITMNAEQHNDIHSSKGKEMEEQIILIKGEEWLRDINRQKNKVAKYLKFDDVYRHIVGLSNNYC